MGLYDELRVRLLRYILSFGICVQDGEDIIQETFLALFRHLQMGRSRRNLHSWIFRVGHNLALKRRYANQRFQSADGADSRAPIRVDPSPNAEEQMTMAERRHRLLLVVHALPEQDQRCLALRAEGLRYREIAEVLGISLATVSVSLSRSLTRLACADAR